MTHLNIDSNELLEDSNTTNEAAIDAADHDVSKEALVAETKKSTSERRQEAINLTAKLAEAYPNIFPKTGSGRPVALAIGLHKELLPIIQEWGFTAVTLRSTLAWYTRQLRYQRALFFSSHRVNLDGSQAEEITEEQKILAKETIDKIEIWLNENKPEKAKQLAERKSKFTEHKKKKTTAPKHHKSSAKKHSAPAESTQPTQKSPPATLDEKMQGLLSKFNQH